ncbi:MAG: cobalamin-dependent protein [Nitrospiraceae bacterium]|nr:MAG: cobalamin-dependent protein [Nitrospiraceae bacterium]
MKTQSKLISAIADLNEESALKLIRQRLAENDDPLTLIGNCEEGLQRVGERYARHEYYLSGLIMGGEIFYEVMELIRPAMESRISDTSSGKVLLGTVQSDIHDLGKNIVKLLLSCYKLTVYDLGVDVPPEEFLRQAKKLRPDILGLSGLVTNAYDSMRETIRLFRQEGYQIPTVIGGSQLSKEVFQYTGADYWVNKADAGVKLILRLLK